MISMRKSPLSGKRIEQMTKVVLDTNVVVSAFLSPAGKPGTILRLVLRGDFDLCMNTAILAEYEKVLCLPKFIGPIHLKAIQRFIDILHEIGTDVICSPSSIGMPDESDRKFYDVAIAAEAILVTGNKKHYPNESFIMNPSEFLTLQG